MIQLEKGTQLHNGEYTIVKSLGQGGFGITYLAEQSGLGRMVAVKEFFVREMCDRAEDGTTVTSTSGSKEMVERCRAKFVTEAKLLASLKHPNIVGVHAVFDENNTSYYVMDYVDGQSLSELIKSSPLPEAKALGYIREVGKALEYIHSKNIYHLDVKPSNILLDKDGSVMLIDFGISKQVKDSEGNTLSVSSALGHTPGYSPTEQVEQKVENYGPWTDIYALGATLYRLLTCSKLPSTSEILEGGETAFHFPDHITPATRKQILWMMTPIRTKRPQSMAELFSALDDEEVTVGPTSEPVVDDDPDTVLRDAGKKKEPETTETDTKRTGSRVQGIIAGILVVLVIIGFGLLYFGSHQETKRSQEIVGDTFFQEPFDTLTNMHANHEYVDLGLSVKWATCNIGASSPEEYGDYFAWGETTPKDHYDWDNYFDNPSHDGETFIKYNNEGGKTVLEPENDVAHVKWGGNWRMPTKEELDELYENCTWTWVVNGVNGYKVTSKTNGNSIFLPAAGYRVTSSLYNAGSYGYYWSSSLYSGYSSHAYSLYFYSGGVDWGYYGRYYGLSVRAVCPYPQNLPQKKLLNSNKINRKE